MSELGGGSLRLGPGLGVAGYAAWLERGLRQFFFEGKGTMSFVGLGQHYGRNPSIGDDIVEAVRTLPELDKLDFRDAVVRLIRETSFDIEPLYLEALLIIAQRMGANAALAVIAQKAFTLPPGTAADTVVRYAFELARDLALTAGPQAELCIKHIVSQPAFSPQFAGQALEALTAANPNDFAKHFRLLQDKLELVFGSGAAEDDYVKLQQRRRILVRSVSKYCVFTDSLLVDPTSDNQSPERLNWWLEALAQESAESDLKELFEQDILPKAPDTDPEPVPPDPTNYDEDEPDPAEAEELASKTLGHRYQSNPQSRAAETEYEEELAAA